MALRVRETNFKVESFENIKLFISGELQRVGVMQTASP